MEELREWKTRMEAKDLRVNAGRTKTNVIQCRLSRVSK